MDYDPELYHNTAADVLGPQQQLVDILHKHLATDVLDEVVNENGFAIFFIYKKLEIFI